MKSPVVKRSIVVAGHKTSVSLEEAFWNGMKEISGLRDMTLSELVGEIDSNRQQGNLSSAIRLFVLDYFRTRAMPDAAEKALSRMAESQPAMRAAAPRHARSNPAGGFRDRSRVQPATTTAPRHRRCDRAHRAIPPRISGFPDEPSPNRWRSK